MKPYKKLFAEVVDLSESTDEALSLNALVSDSGQAAAVLPMIPTNMIFGTGGLDKSRFTKVLLS